MEIIENREISEIIALYEIEENIPGLALFNSTKKELDTVKGRPFRSNHYGVVIVSEGSLLMRVNLSSYRLKRGDVLLVAPSAIKEFISVKAGTRVFIMVFTPELLYGSGFYKTHVKLFHFLSAVVHQCLKAAPSALDYLFSLRNIVKTKVVDRNSPSYHQSCELLLYLFLLQLGDIYDAQLPPTSAKELDRKRFICSKFLQLLSTSVTKHKDVQFYADKLHVNAKYLSQVLKEKTKKPATKHIIEMVILHAKVLLHNPAYSIAEVADKIGFTDQFTFSKYFKKNTGFTPSFYRSGNPGKSK